jgi:5-methylthioadenosine/S-adenosylhomocysteine deaminase
MKFGALLQKINEMDPATAPALEIFNAATKNGTKALKINSGAIKKGKLADLILIDLNNICLSPKNKLISNLVYSCSGDFISDVICNGKILMQDRKVKEEEKILKETKRAYPLDK